MAKWSRQRKNGQKWSRAIQKTKNAERKLRLQKGNCPEKEPEEMVKWKSSKSNYQTERSKGTGDRHQSLLVIKGNASDYYYYYYYYYYYVTCTRSTLSAVTKLCVCVCVYACTS